MHDTQLTALAGKTVLVTGGCGLIGSRITAYLHRIGSRPVSLCTMDAYPRRVYRDLFGVDINEQNIVVGNVQDPTVVNRLVAECDYVIHAAALADVAACTRRPMAAVDTNVTGTQVLLNAVSAQNGHVRRFCFISSASVYGNGNPEDWTPPSAEHRSMGKLLEAVYGQVLRVPRFSEDMALRPVPVYGNTKAWGETQTALALGAAGIPYTVVRYFSVYGEPQVIKQASHSWVVAWFAARAALGLPLRLNGGGQQIRDLVHVDDIAMATIRALVAPQAENTTLNVGTGAPTSIRAVAELIARHYPAAQLIDAPMPPGDPLGGCADTHRMESVLRWRPTITLEDGVARYTAWLKNNPEAVPVWLRDESATTTA